MTVRDSGATTYRLSCTACAFTTTVEGDLDAVMDRVEEHTGGRDTDDTHFVEFEVVEW